MIDSSLGKEDTDELLDVLSAYQDVFEDTLGHTNVVKHTINTGNNQPVRHRPRRLPYAHRVEAEHQMATTKKRYSDTTIQRYTEPEPGAGAGAARKLFKLINNLRNYCSQSPQETLVIAFSGKGGGHILKNTCYKVKMRRLN